MFRFEFFADDRHVATILRAVANLTHDLKVVPVVNVEKPLKNGQLKAQHNGDSFDIFAKNLTKAGVVEFAAGDVKAAMKQMGFSPSSYSYVLRGAIKRGLVKKKPGGKGTQSRYLLVGDK